MELIRHLSRWKTAVSLAGAVAIVLTPVPATAFSGGLPAPGSAEITAVLHREAAIAGTAWWTDPATGQVTVSYDDTVTGSRLTRLTSVTARFPGAVRVERTPGRLDLRISGGDAIYSGSARCTLGFNVENGAGTDYFLMAGHCANVGSAWYGAGGVYLGTVAGRIFPGEDEAIVRYGSSVSRPGNVNLYNGSYQDIVSFANPYGGQAACHSGSTSKVHCGSIIGLNATVNYPQGTVYGLIKSNICSEPGDSGGPLFDRTVGLGIISGGSGNCTTGGVTYYQPVVETAQRYGVNPY